MSEPQASASGHTEAAGTAPRHYSAFISYTDADRAKAVKLQARLERYRLPPKLARQLGSNRIKPVFLDRSEMRAASDLGRAIREALDRSDFLIVLCTPRTPHSHWVGREIDVFRELHGEDRILVALFDGEKQDCFHPRLLAGRSDSDAEPLAADFRKQGDGNRLGLLKIVASLVGVELDQLIHRDARRQRNFMAAASGIVAAIALLIAGSLYLTYRARASAVEQRIKASQAMERQLNVLRAKIKAGGTLDMAAAVNQSVELFYDGQQDSSQLPAVELGRAQVLQAKAADDLDRGRLDEAAKNARSAWQISSDVLSREPHNTKAIFVHAQSAFYVGYAALQQRDSPLAANAFARYADLADQLVKADPNNVEWQSERGQAYVNLGTVALQNAKDPVQAERYFNDSQSAFREALKLKPNDLNLINGLQVAEADLSDVAVMRGDLAATRRHRDEQGKLIDELLKSQPNNRSFLTYHLSNEIGQARLDAAEGHFETALHKLRASHAEAVGLEAADRENAWVGGQKRMIELLEAQMELELAARGSSTRSRAEALLGDCSRDWAHAGYDELAAFCSILSARAALMRGDRQAAKQIMADQRLDKWLESTSLSTFMRLDFQAECRKLGDPALCK